MSADAYERALDKIRPRWAEFRSRGWTQLDLICCAVKRHGHHGLALYIQKNWDIARIWDWCCELLGSPSGSGERSRLYYWRSAPEVALVALHGPQVVPAELRKLRMERL